tara:strand:+ start:137 stop:655 length:519 start_codon:yes stop_codon:yes gene_type:complete
MKICSKCKTNKEFSDFGFSRPRILRSDCKSCQKEYNRLYRLNNKEKVSQWVCNGKENRKIYRSNNKEKRNEYLKRWLKANPEKTRDQKYRHRYGINIEDYNKMLKQQKGLCKICGSNDYGKKSAKYFVIDHCHTSKKVRGLLCHKCNVILGLCKDNTDILQKSIEYLKQIKC